jgi:RNA polymerase sigma-70 factor (ECF subfamily)
MRMIETHEAEATQEFAEFHKLAYHIAHLITKDPHLSQDVVQEAFFKAWLQKSNLRDPQKFKEWIAAITTRTALDLLRKQKRWTLTLRPAEEVPLSVEQEVEQKLQAAKVRSAIAGLKPEFREVLELKFDRDMKDEDIARRLGCKVGTVKSRLHRAKLLVKVLWLDDEPRL